MTTYGRLWWCVVLPMAAVGAAESLLAVPPHVAWTSATAGAAVSGLCCVAWLPAGSTRTASTRQVIRVVVPGASAGLVVAGLSTLLGGAAALLFVAAVCLHPRLVTAVAARVRRRLHPGTGPAVAPTVTRRPAGAARVRASGPDAWASTRPGDWASKTIPRTDSFAWPDAAAVRLLSTSQLCWGWRVSFAALERAGSPVDQRRWTALVAVRRRYLDEIARRDPVGFGRWLYAGARPASDPGRYLLATGDRPPTLPSPLSSGGAPAAAAGSVPTEDEAPDA